MKEEKIETPLRIAVLGHKCIPSHEGGIEIVVEELGTCMNQHGLQVTQRSGSDDFFDFCLDECRNWQV